MSKHFYIVSTLTAEQLTTMLRMQDELNSHLNTNWKAQGWMFNVAFADECMEFLGHLGWKWWKDTKSYMQGVNDSNLRQLQLELVDMFHFFLSSELVYQDCENIDSKERAAELAQLFADMRDQATVEYTNVVHTFSMDPISCVLALVSDVVNLRNTEGRGSINGEALYALLCLTGFNATDLYETYVGKYALNKFRWANGYAEGTYMKNWMIPEVSAMYQEDNWYLEMILKDFKDNQIEVTEQKVYGALSNYYERVTGKTGMLH